MRLLTIAAAWSAALLGTNPALSQTKVTFANLTPGIGVGAAVVAPRALPASAQKRDLTLDEALGGGVRLSAVADAKIAWLDKSTYVVERGNSQFAYDAVSGEQRPLKPLAASPDPAPTGRFRRRPDGSKHPTGAYTVTVRDHDVYVTETKTSNEKRITKDGSPTIFNGALDWVYEEEVYGRGTKQVFQWSPDGRYLAFLRLDEAPVKRFVLVDHLPKLQKTEEEHYPKAGEPNPVAQLLIVDVTKSDPVPVAMDLGLFPDPDRLIVRFGFTPDSRKLIAQIQNKEQNKLDLCASDPATGGGTRYWIQERNEKGWVDVTGGPQWLADGSFLWWSDRSGHRHLYRYAQDGTLLHPVTKGDWDVRSILRLDEPTGRLWVETNAEQVSGNAVFRARLDGKAEPVRITQGGGSHQLTFAPGGNFFLDTVSDALNPGEVRVCDVDGKLLRVVSRFGLPAAADDFRLGIPRFVTFPARDGYRLEGTLLLPPDWDGKTPLPVFCPVYAGPDAPTARNNWNAVNANAYHQFLAQKGIAVWTCDNRTANPRGNSARYAQYKQFGVSELRDIEDGLSFLEKQGILQPGRAAISGWSFGGFMAAYALTRSDKFKVGIAGAGVMDWQLYDTIYTERYMSTPQRNPQGYKVSSVVDGASNLKGRLLIVHGMMDDNVHAQNSVQLVYALQKAGKQFDMMFYPAPTSRHGIGDPDQSRHQRLLGAKFLLENL